MDGMYVWKWTLWEGMEISGGSRLSYWIVSSVMSHTVSLFLSLSLFFLLIYTHTDSLL